MGLAWVKGVLVASWSVLERVRGVYVRGGGIEPQRGLQGPAGRLWGVLHCDCSGGVRFEGEASVPRAVVPCVDRCVDGGRAALSICIEHQTGAQTRHRGHCPLPRT